MYFNANNEERRFFNRQQEIEESYIIIEFQKMISYVTTCSRAQNDSILMKNRKNTKNIQYVALLCCLGFVALHSISVLDRIMNSGITNIGSLRHEHDDNAPQTLEQGDLPIWSQATFSRAKSSSSEVSCRKNVNCTDNHNEQQTYPPAATTQKNKQTQKTQTCQRICKHRRNIISYVDDPAGLSDRKVVLHDLSQLAGYLCAKLVIPPPSALLNSDHNNGVPIKDNIAWSDLYNITFSDDHSQTIQFLDKNTAEHVVLDGEQYSWTDVPIFRNNNSSKKKDWLHIVSTDGKLKHDFQTVQEFSFQQNANDKVNDNDKDNDNDTNGFIWEIHKKWYPSDLWDERLPVLAKKYGNVRGQSTNQEQDQPKDDHDHDHHYKYKFAMRPYLKTYFGFHPKISLENQKGCLYTDEETSPSHIQMLQKRLMKRIHRLSPNNTKLGLLQLRRGDTLEECDTSIDRMRDYFACSLNGTEKLGSNLTMLFTSDEVDKGYRRGIMEQIGEYRHVSIIDADELVEKVVREAIRNGVVDADWDNNYFIFEVESILRDWSNEMLKFHLVRRRSTCNDCIPLEQRLRAKMASEMK